MQQTGFEQLAMRSCFFSAHEMFASFGRCALWRVAGVHLAIRPSRPRVSFVEIEMGSGEMESMIPWKFAFEKLRHWAFS